MSSIPPHYNTTPSSPVRTDDFKNSSFEFKRTVAPCQGRCDELGRGTRIGSSARDHRAVPVPLQQHDAPQRTVVPRRRPPLLRPGVPGVRVHPPAVPCAPVRPREDGPPERRRLDADPPLPPPPAGVPDGVLPKADEEPLGPRRPGLPLPPGRDARRVEPRVRGGLSRRVVDGDRGLRREERCAALAGNGGGGGQRGYLASQPAPDDDRAERESREAERGVAVRLRRALQRLCAAVRSPV